MTVFAIALVLSAAGVHASWNYLLKKSGGGVGFVWLFGTMSVVFYAPLALAVAIGQDFELTLPAFAFILASAVIHTAYYLLLDRGYRFGDLSLVYPLARATGPLLTIVIAVLVLGERPGPIALCGAALIIGGAFFLTGDPAKLAGSGALRGVAFALLTGCTIAAYTITDKQAVSRWAVPPLLFDWSMNLLRMLLMTPLGLRDAAGLKNAWRRHRKTAIAVALLNPLSYILILTAMVFTPVSYVAPAREISILIAALMGTQLLSEGHVGRRLVCAAAMALGVVALAIG